VSASAVVSISGDGGSPGAMLGDWACASSATAAGAGVSAGAASASGFRDEAMARGDSYRRVRNLGWFLRMLERTEGMDYLWLGGGVNASTADAMRST